MVVLLVMIQVLYCTNTREYTNIPSCRGKLVYNLYRLQEGIFIPPRSRRDIVLVSSVSQSVHSVRFYPTFCLSGTISQYLLVRFDLFLVQMISITDSRYPISFVKIDPLTLELLPFLSIGNYNAKPILAFFV